MILTALWADENGVVISAELVVILTVLVLALAVGLTALRDALVTELGDIGGAVGTLNQSYSYGGIRGHCAFTGGSSWFDLRDVAVNEDLDDGLGASNGIVVCAVVATPEGGAAIQAVTPEFAPQQTSPVEAEPELQADLEARLARN